MNALQKIDQNEVQVAQATSEASSLMTIIERISTMPELDLDRVERLFDMHQKMLDRQQEQLFNQALALAQSEIEGVVVNKSNDHTRSKYANIEAIHAEAKPIWTKHGFSVLTRSGTSEQPGHIRLYTEVRHSGGHKVTYEDDWPLDTAGARGNSNKTAIQGKGSTITYARRYTELMIFDIAIKDEDNDGAPNTPQNPALLPITTAQLKILRDAAKIAGVDDFYICQKAGIERITDLQQGRLAGAINHLKNLSQGKTK